MGYKVFDTSQCEEWDAIVCSFSTYDIYYLSGYVKAFEINGDGKAYLFYYMDETTKAINVFMKRDIATIPYLGESVQFKEYFDIVTPYGYGGFLVEGDHIHKVCQAYEEFCMESGIIAEFVRFHPLLQNWSGLEEFYKVQYCGKTVHMDISNEEAIWHNITSKNRNMIRKAQKAGLKAYWGRENSLIESFMELYHETMKRDHASDYYYFKQEFYESILNDLKYRAMWFYTKLDNEIASISIFLYANKSMHYHLSASKKELQNLAPTNLLLYEAALWGCENGYEKLHLGGGVGAQEDSLYQFKKAFNRYEGSSFYVGKRVYNPEVYRNLTELRQKMKGVEMNYEYFPQYRG
ncbi:MAG: GNAT family N-acetyltransferase [Lachnospiraceae bacterium]|jgi:hypothetical protein|nr:GNAT family N-acetyltransferase [Lachnospiraceae bacterium]